MVRKFQTKQVLCPISFSSRPWFWSLVNMNPNGTYAGMIRWFASFYHCMILFKSETHCWGPKLTFWLILVEAHITASQIKGQVFPSKGGWSAPDYSYSLAYTILYIKGAVSAESQSQSNKIISYVVAWPISVVKPSMRLKSIFKYVTF